MELVQKPKSRYLQHLEANSYIEIYKTFQTLGYGTMLCYWTGTKLIYVQFTPETSDVKKILDKKLLDNYKREFIFNT